MTYTAGAWKACCDRCGFEYLNTKLRLEWNGLRTCSGKGTNDCWEPRHPQDFVRGKKDRQAPPWVRPEPADVFITPGPIDPDAL
jgi:hypothetical protein